MDQQDMDAKLSEFQKHYQLLQEELGDREMDSEELE